MSKVGKAPIEIPDNVEVAVDGNTVSVKGPRGELARGFPSSITVKVEGSKVVVEAKNKSAIAMHGTSRALIANMVKGVSEGWTKELEMVGTGYRAETKGNDLVLTVGYSHPVTIEGPEGISFKVEKLNITVEGVDKELVGQVAAKIRAIRPPEPYKGKGIKYKDEVVRRKPGKAAKAAGAGVA
jgi:large subunit ribosomal protein L6